jgi:hypothetical protein
MHNITSQASSRARPLSTVAPTSHGTRSRRFAALLLPCVHPPPLGRLKPHKYCKKDRCIFHVYACTRAGKERVLLAFKVVLLVVVLSMHTTAPFKCVVGKYKFKPRGPHDQLTSTRSLLSIDTPTLPRHQQVLGAEGWQPCRGIPCGASTVGLRRKRPAFSNDQGQQWHKEVEVEVEEGPPRHAGAK